MRTSDVCRGLLALSPVLVAACQATPEVAPLETPLPAWSSPTCYNVHGPYRASPAPPSFSCSRLKAEGPPVFAWDRLLGGSDGKVVRTALVEATVLGDTRHGHTPQGALAGRQGLLLGQLVNRNPVRPLAETTLLLEYSSGPGGALRDLTGQRLRAEIRQRAVPAPTIGRPAAVILRNLDGQLLMVSLHATFTEYLAEVLPEIRLRQVNTRADVLERPCQTGLGKGTERYRTADLELVTLNQTETLGPCQAARVAVGCVEYVVTTGKLEQRISDDECDLDTPEIEVTITRRAMLEPASDPFQ